MVMTRIFKITVLMLSTVFPVAFVSCTAPRKTCPDFLSVSRLRELRISYWIRVRPAGIYDGVSDSGIRKRIFRLTNRMVIAESVVLLDWTESMKSERAQGAGDVMLYDTDGIAWGGSFTSKDSMSCIDGTERRLRSSKFYFDCLYACAAYEGVLRHAKVDVSCIALSPSDAEALPSLNFNERVDGVSSEEVLVFGIEDLLKNARN